MFNGWKYFTGKEAAYEDDARRNGRQSDYWTDSPQKSWLDPSGVRWVLTFIVETREMMLFSQDEPGPAWVSPAWDSQDSADVALEGWGSAQGDWNWLSDRLAR